VGAAAAVLAVTPALVAHADSDAARNEPYLLGRAVLDDRTFAGDVPPIEAGKFYAPSPSNGWTFPVPDQPVEGFSGIVAGRQPGEYLMMPDNGFGSKVNSPDFLIRAYYVTPDFKTAHGGTGAVEIDGYISFRDPDGVIGFPIVKQGTEERLLTGGDIDPESIQRDHHGDLWVGDEFGPWILHFDAEGVLQEAPIALPGVKSPSNPLPEGPVTTINSRGIEGMALSPNGRTLTVVVEGAVRTAAGVGDDPFTRRIYQYDTSGGTPPALVGTYRVHAPDAATAAQRFVSDVQALDGHRLLVMERDGGRGLMANFRSVYEIDLNQVDENGVVLTTRLLDLTDIPDPDLVSLPAINDGDVGLGDPFRVTCESIEALYVVSHAELLLGCDNNLPNSGRNPNLADDSEFILVKAPGL
jgi:glycerophosphoryl diester phosphodiesterase